MPWSPSDAKSHDSKVKTPEEARQWADVANSVLRRTGSDAEAVKQANGVIRRREGKL